MRRTRAGVSERSERNLGTGSEERTIRWSGEWAFIVSSCSLSQRRMALTKDHLRLALFENFLLDGVLDHKLENKDLRK
jgi:hypothetical protein